MNAGRGARDAHRCIRTHICTQNCVRWLVLATSGLVKCIQLSSQLSLTLFTVQSAFLQSPQASFTGDSTFGLHVRVCRQTVVCRHSMHNISSPRTVIIGSSSEKESWHFALTCGVFFSGFAASSSNNPHQGLSILCTRAILPSYSASSLSHSIPSKPIIPRK